MKWDHKKSLVLTEVCVVIFAVLLLLLDIFMQPCLTFFLGLRFKEEMTIRIVFSVIMYVSSVFGWIFLFHMWKLLTRIKDGDIFTEENVKHLRVISWCLIAVGIIALCGIFWYLPFLMVTLAGFFCALIVRIVKNIFEQAILMKDELDLTI